MMDKVFIRNLQVDAIIGIYDFERVKKQPIIITLEMQWDNKKPASTENILDALDYEKISNSVKTLIENSSFQLVETLAETTEKVTLELNKPEAISFAESVGIIITRQKSDYL